MANNNENKILNVPHLRFPEFSGEWKKCIIQDYGEVVTGNTPPTNNAEYYNNGSYLWASPADLGINKNVTDTKTKLSLSGFKKTRNVPKGSGLSSLYRFYNRKDGNGNRNHVFKPTN